MMTLTESPTRILTKFFRIFPDIVASTCAIALRGVSIAAQGKHPYAHKLTTVFVGCNSTRNIAFGRLSVTLPSSCHLQAERRCQQAKGFAGNIKESGHLNDVVFHFTWFRSGRDLEGKMKALNIWGLFSLCKHDSTFILSPLGFPNKAVDRVNLTSIQRPFISQP